MGILRRLREWREDKDGTLIGPNIEADSVDAGSVNTGSLTDKSDGQAWETLRNAGWDQGDFFPLPLSGNSIGASVASDTYQKDTSTNRPVPWQFYPDDTEFAVAIRGDAGGDQIDVQAFDNNAVQAIGSETSVITGTGIQVGVAGPFSYTPPNSDDIVVPQLRIRNADNTTTVEVFDFMFFTGVGL